MTDPCLHAYRRYVTATRRLAAAPAMSAGVVTLQGAVEKARRRLVALGEWRRLASRKCGGGGTGERGRGEQDLFAVALR